MPPPVMVTVWCFIAGAKVEHPGNKAFNLC
jgi:hypothetical protein